MTDPIKTDEITNPEFGNLKVLIAEDNEVNQLLAKGILRHWGFETRIAENGVEVLSLLQQEDFDLVLMDIQMPEKDGIEAANEIRELKDQKKKSIPIIALTANALKGEEKKYIAAGMDDFLTKPFKEAELYEVIARVFRKEGSFGRDIEVINETGVEQEFSEKQYDLVQLEEIAAGNKDFMVALANIYVSTVPENSTEMVAATKAGDWMKVSKLAHKLKSTIDTMNIVKIKSDIRVLEIDAKNKVNTDQLHKVAVKVDKVIHIVADQLKRELLCG